MLSEERTPNQVYYGIERQDSPVGVFGCLAYAKVYVRNKGEQTAAVGMKSIEHKLSENTSQEKLLKLIQKKTRQPCFSQQPTARTTGVSHTTSQSSDGLSHVVSPDSVCSNRHCCSCGQKNACQSFASFSCSCSCTSSWACSSLCAGCKQLFTHDTYAAKTTCLLLVQTCPTPSVIFKSYSSSAPVVARTPHPENVAASCCALASFNAMIQSFLRPTARACDFIGPPNGPCCLGAARLLAVACGGEVVLANG